MGRYIMSKMKTIVLLLVFAGIFLCTFMLYHLPLNAVLYPMGLCIAIGLIYMIVHYMGLKRKHEELEVIKGLKSEMMEGIPKASDVLSQDYLELIEILRDENRISETYARQKFADMVDYYTVWAHQIKTPIASMRLNLQNEDTALSRSLNQDLSRIERYVEMVLAFVRLDSDSTDYIIRRFSIDEIVKGAIRKQRSDFINKKLSLDYTPSGKTVLTDEKWLSFVIEQILSNAVKYTSEGSVSIYMEGDVLCIRDTGIGIAAEDIPRVFENGYTGFNGRADKRASGIGLYLCRKVCDRLGHSISIESKVGEGTVVRLDFSEEKLGIE